MTKYRNTWAEIDLQAIRDNLKQLKQLLPEDCNIMGVVKANGYGHGSVEVANALVQSGINHLMVAYLEEAIELREHQIEQPILVISRIPPKFVQVAVDHQITLSISQASWLHKALSQQFVGKLSIHVEFETGFNRTGIQTIEELREIVNIVKAFPHKLEITGVYTHFATADEIDSAHYDRQKTTYERMLSELKLLYSKPMVAHTGNSAAGIQYPNQMRQFTRFGIALYGLYPSKQIEQLNRLSLKQAFSLYSELIEVKKINQGEFVGYGITYEAEEDQWIGTIPIGYADGWSRALQGFHVLINGKKQPIVGRICMDMTMVRLDQNYEIGEKVTLIGEDDGEVILIDDVAQHLKTINYEIPCMITNRVPREYIN